MIGIDTNVLVRFLIRDDPKQAAAASRFMAKARADRDELLINNIVLCELVWVLDSVYGIAKRDIVMTLRRLFMTYQFRFEATPVLSAAIDSYENGKADFSDYLIGRVNWESDAQTVTFDRALKGTRYFRVL